MAYSNRNRRGTGMVDSDVQELVTQWNQGGSYYVVNSAIAINGAGFSVSAFVIWGTNGTCIRVTAAGTGGGFTGMTIGTGRVAVAAAYITQAGTHVVAMGNSAASFGGCPIPTVPSTAYVYGALLFKGSGASAFTGGTTNLD